MYIYKVTRIPKWPSVYDPKTGILLPLSKENTVNDPYKETIDKYLKIKSIFYFPHLSVMTSWTKMDLQEVTLPAFKMMLSKIKPFDKKYKILFLETLCKYMPVIPVSDYVKNYNLSYVNITAVVFPSKPNVLCISFVSQKKQIRAIKFCEHILVTNANVIDKNIRAGFMSIDFSQITSVSKVNLLLKSLLSFLCEHEETRDQIQLYSKKIINKSNKKVRFSTRIYFNEDIPRPRKTTCKGILKKI